MKLSTRFQSTGEFGQHCVTHSWDGMCLHLVTDRAADAGGVRKRECTQSNGKHLSARFKLELKLDSATAASLPSERSNFTVLAKDSGEKGE